MTRRQAALAVALALTAQGALAQDDRAVPRGGGSSGGSAGRDHHAGASSPREGGSSGGGSQTGGGSSYEPTLAQRRHPRAGTGSGHGKGGVYYYGAPYYGSPYYGYGYYGSPFYGGWGYGYYSPYYYSGFYGYSPYYYGSSRGSATGSVRVLVEPTETRVYVDGYYAGVADDFDGIFQRLNLAPGRHDISLRLDGHRTQNFRLYVPYDHTIKIHHKMVPGSPGEASEQVIGRPEDVADARRDRDERYADRDDAEAEDERDHGPGDMPGETGTVRLSVNPTDASIYVDGAFRGTGRLRSLRLTPGRHRIEVVRPGYRTLEREVDVEPGREVEVSFELDRS